MNIATIVSGALVFAAAGFDHIPLSLWLFGNAVGIFAILAGFFSLILQWRLISQGKFIIIRILAGFQVTMILVATTFFHYPRIVILTGEEYLSLLEHRGQEKTIESLAVALLAGSAFILPALFYLIYSFQKKKAEEI